MKNEMTNPVQDMIQGNMPGLPQIIQNAMPPELPRATYQQSSIELFFGNIKRKQLVKSAKAEADLARYSREQVENKLEVVHSLFTFSAKVADTLGEFEHRKTMRALDIQEKHGFIQKIQSELKILDLEAKEKESLIQQIQYQTALIAQEVEAAKLDNRIKFKNAKDILGEEGL